MFDVATGDTAIVLGRIPHLAEREIELSLARSGRRIDLLNVTSGVALVKASPTPDAAWFHTLGGAVKFGTVLDVIAPDAGSLVGLVEQQLGKRSRLGLSAMNLGSRQLRELGQALKLAGLTRRFVTADSGGLLSAAQSKQFRADRDAELLILPLHGQWVIIQVTAAQNIDAFTLRDRGAPHQHARRGMLPTKLARTMVNLGLGLVSDLPNPRLLDPFCGTGRVLMEGMLLGAQVWGSDIDPLAIEATHGNLVWLQRRYELPAQPWAERLTATDVANLGSYVQPGSIDVIVTEPDLGPPQTRMLQVHEAKHVLNAIQPMYEHLLQVGSEILTPAGAMVMVFPVIGQETLRARMVDTIARLGYHALDSFRVARDEQFVSRDIVLLRRESRE